MARMARAVGRLAFVLALAVAFEQLVSGLDGPFEALWTLGVLKVVLWVVPVVALTWLAVRGQDAPNPWTALGLGSPAWRGYAFGVAVTVPLALVWLTRSRPWPGVDSFVGDVLLGPVAEEVLFRGFLFLALRRLGVGFWSAGVVSSAAFGIAHVPSLFWHLQFTWAGLLSGAFLEMGLGPWWLQTAAVTVQIGAGGLLFAWVLERSGSLWLAIGLHAAINFWWEMVHGVEAPLRPDVWANVPWALGSAATVVLAATLAHRWASRPAGATVFGGVPMPSAVD